MRGPAGLNLECLTGLNLKRVAGLSLSSAGLDLKGGVIDGAWMIGEGCAGLGSLRNERGIWEDCKVYFLVGLG